MDVRDAFVAMYGAPPNAVASAPGRVNLIGEHIDYMGYSVLPIALAQVADSTVTQAINASSAACDSASEQVFNSSTPQAEFCVHAGLQGGNILAGSHTARCSGGSLTGDDNRKRA